MSRQTSLTAATFGVALLLLLNVQPASADDRSDVTAAISAQLQAFRADDAAAAYTHAAPNITNLFPTAEQFMSMVRRGYAQVYRAGNVTFGPMTAEGTGFRQEVFLTDPEGRNWIASYTLARQPDGSMKITGVQIRESDDLSA